jgi:ABC-type branched-subunit amino acid transport system ATPase component
VRRPELLLLDEAAAGLDRADKALLIDQVRALAAGGTTVCLIEHDTDLVSHVCSNVTVLDVGTVLARGTGREIFRDANVRASYMGTRSRRVRTQGLLAPASAADDPVSATSTRSINE